MCGIPLPHPPITAPGAQSTLSLTRVPLESGSGRSGQNAPSTVTREAGALAESPQTGAGLTTAAAPAASDTAVRAPAAVADEPPAVKELVPDVSLEDYVQKFRYEPPNESAETTMRGEAAVVEREPLHVVTPRPAPGTDVAVSARPVRGDAASNVMDAPASGDSVEDRLGLEPGTPAEARVPRPRFLDVNDPAPESKPVGPGTSTIVGPSFLGLSDAPQIGVEPAGVDETPRTSHWRAWFALAVLMIFAALGAMEWRSQVRQTNRGPVEVIREKIRDWRSSQAGPAAQSAPAPATSPDNNAKPEMQVQEQPKPQAPGETTSATGNGLGANAGGSTPAPAAAQPNPPSSTASLASAPSAASGQSASANSQKPPAPSKPPAGQTAAAGETANRENSAAAATRQNAAEKPKPARPSRETQESETQEVTVRQVTPGAEEMTKARNASDSVAAAAWLWKATAKGNPDAPVRLAEMYMKGDGVPRSCEQAVVLLKTAAEKENARARNRLGSMYATGNCVQRNRVEAYRWLSSALAADPNSDWARQNRDLMWQQMTPDERLMAAKYR
ncbi:MAG TPA: tetratricopeptide repeat protein [Candidatus Binatia bacterium]|nr:tetratricopeptide repeat protein [Candidatus Binatia bacterium]